MSDFKESIEYQRTVWDSIAQLWHQHRQSPMPEVVEFLKEFKYDPEAKVLDLCCGSGRHFESIAGELHGVDFSDEMLKYAKEDSDKKGIRVILHKAYAHKLPFPDEEFDAIVFTASLHSIETNFRRTVLQEIKRVLKPGGKIIITVWNKRQPLFFFKRKIAYIPWRKDGKKYLRYYYLYTKKELRKEIEENSLVVDSIKNGKNKAFKMFPKNIVLLAHKPDE